jgi:hypothetical protein
MVCVALVQVTVANPAITAMLAILLLAGLLGAWLVGRRRHPEVPTIK